MSIRTLKIHNKEQRQKKLYTQKFRDKYKKQPYFQRRKFQWENEGKPTREKI